MRDAVAARFVMPRFKRGIQYTAVLICLNNVRHGVLDRPVEPGDDNNGR